MRTEEYDVADPQNLSVAMRRVALAVVCVALFAIFGVAAPYKIYKYYEAMQDTAAVSTLHGEL